MMRPLSKIRDLLRGESGAATVSFVLVVPVFFFIFVNAFEIHVHSIRQVMVDRAVDLAARDVRIGYLTNPTHDDLTAQVCKYARLIENCERDIRLDMTVVDPRNLTLPTDATPCRDRAEENPPEITLANGENNKLMLLRVCILFDPAFNYAGVGRKILIADTEYYAMQAATAYVMEPFK
ncbi:TadE/TadG family type IV pilus assembly protein [Loktanella sp. SALINAS62]|uniref:TadE/TadG family type IV pilus assembly protein n=1 Tax=Loktanella sp. SALINAS62 TaxID=2706124 RepID=UPI001B8ACCD8|nr:TadE/TadG family type IV pilus assembly protein [Loktanella sp. SALINAS62]MBS1303872.1 pilus assembly protein [Loktanella sp. SALINAS62]